MIEVDHQLLSQDALDNLLMEIILREGTDYGVVEASLENKKQSLLRNLEQGKVKIVFDEKTAQCEIISDEQWQKIRDCAVE